MPVTLAERIVSDALPTIAAGAGAGTSPTVAIQAGSSDSAGVANITTGTTAAAGVLATVTFNRAFRNAPKVILVSRQDAIANALLPAVGTITTTTFVIRTPSTPADSTAYKIAYLVLSDAADL